MRIAHITDHFQPWLGYQETYVPLEQQRLGHEVLIITSNRQSRQAASVQDEQIMPTGRFEERGLQVVRLPCAWESPTRASYVWLRGLKEQLAAYRPEVVHGHGVFTFNSLQAAAWKKRIGYALVLDNHTSFLNITPPTAKPWQKKAKLLLHRFIASTLGRLIVSQADSLVAIGEDEQAYLAWAIQRAPGSIPIIRLGADDQLFRLIPEARQRIRRSLGWQAEHVVLGHAGALRPYKQLDDLLAAVARLAKLRSNIRLLFVGKIDPTYQSALTELANQLGLAEQIAFTGHVAVEKLPEYLSAMDIAVWPGDISITVIEAMSVGLPVVTCRTAYTQAIIEAQQAGLLFARSDIESLSQMLSNLIEFEEMRHQMGRNARTAVERALNWRQIANEFIRLYQTVACNSLPEP